MKTETMKRWIVAAIAIALIISGFSIAKFAESGFGTVRVNRADFVTDDGYKMSAKIYIPKNASPDTPAPGILGLPGGNASLENLSDVAIELSRRGYVVMVVDPYTIGRSDVVTFPDVGSRAAMDYLQALSFVDADAIGAFGHSAGSGRAQWAITTDADRKVIRDGVKAVMYLGAGSFTPDGVNIGLFIGSWDNTYRGNMQSDEILSARNLDTAPHFCAQLGVEKIDMNTWYGDCENGTGRIFYTGNSGHASALILPKPILDTCSFFDTALAKAPLDVSGTIYAWKEICTAIALVGVFMLMFPILSALLGSKFFASIKRPIPAPVSGVNAPFLFYLIMPAVINTLICEWAIYNGQVFLGNFKNILRINNTNGFIFWFGCSALLTILILAIRFKWGKIDKERILTHAKTSWSNFFKSLLVGVIAVGAIYAVVTMCEVFWGLSPRMWKVQVNVLNSTRWGLLLTYFPLYLLFFGVFNFSQTIGLRIEGQSKAGFTALVWLTSTIPAAAFLMFTYGKLWITGYTAITNMQMSRANSTLLNCILTYFISCKVTTYCYQKTGGYHTGAVVNALIMTWTAVATDLITVI